jgi:hypothetical protein
VLHKRGVNPTKGALCAILLAFGSLGVVKAQEAPIPQRTPRSARKPASASSAPSASAPGIRCSLVPTGTPLQVLWVSYAPQWTGAPISLMRCRGFHGDNTGSEACRSNSWATDVCAAGPQYRCAGVAECMAAHLLGDANTACRLSNSIPQQRLVPVRLSAPTVGLAKTQSLAALYFV